MKTITFEEIRAIVAEHQETEAARNAPIAVARRAVFELAALLDDLTDQETVAVLTLIDEEITTPLAAREPAS